jgi:excinuclease ABC subunit C
MAKKEKPDLNKKVHEVPHKPGVYLMRDRFNRVIYVGKARDLRKRVSSYFLPSKVALADLKMRAMLDAVWDFETHTVRSEAESLLLEGKLIKEYRPRYNISFRDDKRFLLVKVDQTEEWPRFRLARFKKDDGALYFGPYAHAGALRQTLNFMRKKFGVLTFGRGSPTPRELKSSTYQVPMKLGEISATAYRERVARACEFLEGHSREMIQALEEEMRVAAEKLDFEKAAVLRNLLEDLRRTTRPTRRFTRGSLPSTVNPEADVHSLADALQLPKTPQVMECFDISNISTTHVVASMVCFRSGVPDKNCYRRYRIRTVEGQDDFASMAEVVRRRYSRVLLEARDAAPDTAEFSQEDPANAIERLRRPHLNPLPQGEEDAKAPGGGKGVHLQGHAVDAIERLGHPERSAAESRDSAVTPVRVATRSLARDDGEKFVAVRLPDLIIVDGGKGQLSAACKELQRLGLHELPIIGLAKEHEDIYRPGRALPLRLPEDSGALRLLQRIRDEAHRFANTYHQLLMKKRIGESILDDCPGVSQNRKNLLLQKFGSVSRLRRASVEEIAATEGIGRKLADEVHRFLQQH